MSPYETTNNMAIISDRDRIIAIAGGSKKEYLEKRISQELEKIMESRNTYIAKEDMKPMKVFYEDTNEDEYTAQIIAPIVMQGDPIGTVILVSKDKDAVMEEIEVKLVEMAAGFLAKQMEN